MCKREEEWKERPKNVMKEGERDGETGRVRAETSADRGVFCGLGGV
jgi:hypothetical protein